MSTTKLKLPTYGGQALMEGVLMRGSHFLSAAFRDPTGKIIIKSEKLGGIYTSSITKIPFLRGIVILWDAVGLGTKYLTFSANIQTGEDEKIEGPAMTLTILVSFALAIGLFFLAPAGLVQLLQHWFNINAFAGNLLEGIIRLLLVIGYMWAVGKMPDIHRVFMYHGAEHKTINAFESGSELTPEKVAHYSLQHPRCGTGFVLIVVVFSVILFSLLGPMSIFWRLASRVLFLPLIIMVAYEYMRFTANHLDNSFIRMLASPNMAMQHLTTSEPTPEMLEVAITAFKSMYEQENPPD
ncbi:MAG: DUF1385 domain-containing protein [Anaerolineaceae bacterium]